MILWNGSPAGHADFLHKDASTKMHYWHWLLLEIGDLTLFYTNKSIARSVWVTLKENIMMNAEL